MARTICPARITRGHHIFTISYFANRRWSKALQALCNGSVSVQLGSFVSMVPFHMLFASRNAASEKILFRLVRRVEYPMYFAFYSNRKRAGQMERVSVVRLQVDDQVIFLLPSFQRWHAPFHADKQVREEGQPHQVDCRHHYGRERLGYRWRKYVNLSMKNSTECSSTRASQANTTVRFMEDRVGDMYRREAYRGDEALTFRIPTAGNKRYTSRTVRHHSAERYGGL